MYMIQEVLAYHMSAGSGSCSLDEAKKASSDDTLAPTGITQIIFLDLSVSKNPFETVFFP